MEFVKECLRKFTDYFIPSPRNVYRPHALRKPWLIFFLTIILTAEAVFIADILARQSAFNFLAAVLPGEVIALTNQERTIYTVGGLQENTLLDAAAQAKANDMAKTGYFAHVGPDGKEPWAWVHESGYDYSFAGENLAVRFSDSADVVNAWMASPTHRANIVKPVYTEIGVGVAEGMYQGSPATFVVQYFGTPHSSVAAAAAQGATVAVAAPQTDRGRLASAVTPTSASSQVQGAEVAQQTPTPEDTAVSAAPTSVTVESQKSNTPWSSFARELVRGEVQPSVVVFWILGAVAVFLLLGLALAFFIHIQVQPTDMLVGGAVVAVAAISLLYLNLQTPFADFNSNAQSASVFGAMPTTGGFIDNSAASTLTP